MTAEQLRSILKGMDVPEHRKDKTTPANLQWLAKNLGKRNSEHKNYAKAMEEIQHALE